MPFEIAKKAIDDAAEITDTTQISEISFGENGDAYLNPYALDIFRYAKSKFPTATRSCATNFQNLTPELIQAIIEEGLLQNIDFNIDGMTEKTFYASKRISIKYVIERFNLLNELRVKFNSNLNITVSILPVRRYIEASVRRLGSLPVKLKDVGSIYMPDESKNIIASIRPALRTTDHIYDASPFLWAERSQVDITKLDYSKYQCPTLSWMLTKAYIAPNGDWYACCFDANNELVVGNITSQTLQAIAVGTARIELIQKLLQQRFSDIGGPCATVNCCSSG